MLRLLGLSVLFVLNLNLTSAILPITVDCSAVLCPIPRCLNSFTPTGKCCPECPNVDCSTVRCAAPNCTNSYTPVGQCCPICPLVKPGVCPKPGIGICAEMCSGDQSCKGHEKCCSNGCGHTCQMPECPNGQNGMCGTIAGLICPSGTTCMFMQDFADGAGKCCINELPIEKPGVCPKPGVGICVDTCFNDQSCKGHDKCCSNGCGHTCQTPECTNGQNGTCGTKMGLVCPSGTTCMFREGVLDGAGKCCINEPKPLGACIEPKESGPCRGAFTRYFYNTATCKCEPFSWGGCSPNGNNFIDLAHCQVSCETPMKANSVCELPKVSGICKAYMPRWWYNKTSCKCESFIYGGCGGNGNNFLTEEWCNTNCGCYECDVCKLPIKPHGGGDFMCLAYIPSYGYNSTSCQCEKFIYSGCGGNANRFATLEECNSRCGDTDCETQEPNCVLPKDSGPCEALIERFYYDPLNCKCKKFNYGGCEGNSNNFPSKRQCKRSCGKTTCPVCNLPKAPGPCKGSFKRFYFNIQTCQCESFIYGGCGGNENRYETLEECQAVCGSIQCPVCNLPPAKGPCKAQLQRWYFDAASCECKTFIYGGCGGNMNRFLTKEDCMGSCGSYPCPVCSEPMKVGPCRAAINRFYYDPLKNKCLKFSWGGCQPNGNNFRNRNLCKKVCKKFVCSLPMKVGPCEALVKRFYYDAQTGECKKFFWGGCESNGNNFRTRRACKRNCM